MERKFIVKPFEVKAGEGPGQFTGRASVYGVKDYYGDVVMPGAFTKSIADLGGEIVVLNQHNPADPIGKSILFDRADALHAAGQLVLDLPSARDAYTRIKNGLVTGISIGYEVAPGGETYKNGVRMLSEIKLMEISLVTFPANTEARITDVRHRGDDDREVLDVIDRSTRTLRELNASVRADMDRASRDRSPAARLAYMQALVRQLTR